MKLKDFSLFTLYAIALSLQFIFIPILYFFYIDLLGLEFEESFRSNNPDLILETLIFQALVIELLLYYQVRALYSIPIAAAIFAAAHYYNPVYAIVTSFAGLLYAYYYYILQKRNKGMAILWLILLHAAWNFIVFLNNDVLKWF